MTGDTPLYDVAAVGNYTKDTVVTPSGTRQVDGGGVRYSAYAAAGLGCRVAAITRLAAEDALVVEELAGAGIDVFPEFTPESTLMRLEYPTANLDERILTATATAGSFTLDHVLSVNARSYLVSGSIRDEIPVGVMHGLRATGATICADVQGFIRIRRPDGGLEHAPWPEQSEVLPLVHILKTDAVEAESITGESDIRAAARALAAFGPREIVLTHRLGILVLADGEFHEAPFHSKEIVGRSGRGDTCLGSYVARRSSSPPEEAIVWSAAVTSLKMEADGPFHREISEVSDLIAREYGAASQMQLFATANPTNTNRGI